MKTYLSRREAADKYNVSIAKLRRWEEKGKLRRLDADLVEPNTSRSDSAVQWVYEEEQLRSLVETSPSKHIVPRNRDAKVFELFDAGKNLVEVVRQTKLPVKDVQPLRVIHVGRARSASAARIHSSAHIRGSIRGVYDEGAR